ncbi:MAG TPA: hypothetical protein VGK79_16560 [Gaiellaceae bacterium]
MVFNELFDPRDADRAQRAVRPLLVFTDAGEVVVDAAGLAAGVGHDHPTSTAATEQRRLEVVVVATLFLAALIVLGENVLDAVPYLGRHQRFVRSVVLDAAIDNDALVVRVLQ